MDGMTSHESMAHIDGLIRLYYQALFQEPCSTQIMSQMPKRQKVDEKFVCVYGKSYCPYCREAKKLVEPRSDAMYIELVENFEPRSQAHVPHIEKSPTIPIVFVNDDHLGGLTELKKFLDE